MVGNEVALHTIFRGVLWFLAMDIAALLILIFWPQVTLFLPGPMV